MLKVDLSAVRSFVNVDPLMNEAIGALDVLDRRTGAGNDFLGWLDLPENTSEELVAACEAVVEDWKKAGINRISFGLQSTNDRELKTLGRIHTYKAFLKSFALARECGFDNINVDLISAIPNQTVESWEQSVRNILELNPEHIDCWAFAKPFT